MLSMRRRLACCTRDREISIDFDEEERITTYNGLEGCIQNNQAYENESRTTRGEGCISDSLEDDDLSCSSSKDAFGSFSSKWLASKRDEQSLNYWELTESPQHFYVKEKPAYALQRTDAEAMKQKFSRLLLGEDITGGRSGVNSALAISNAITQLSVSVFGELWKLEPLPEEKKQKWQCEMDWLLSPANYMVELVPAKQSGANGQTMEIMTPKARADIHMNLPALQKLDSMLIEILDSMVETEFWYTEVGSRAEGRTKSGKQSKRWWLPLPQVPTTGLTDSGRKKLLHQSKMVYQVFKAAKSINEQILLEMPVPTIIRDALPKSERAHLGDQLYRILTAGSSSTEEILNSLMLKSENNVIDAINKLETAILSWKEKITDKGNSKSPIRTSWSFSKDPCTDQLELLLDRAEALVILLKTRYHNLPLSFLDAIKVQYGKDVGHSILEAYSRVIRNLASRILSRMADILHEDALTNPGSPDKTFFSPEVFPAGNIQTTVHNLHVEHLGMACNTDSSSNSEVGFSPSEARGSSVSTTPSRSLVWCIVREACAGVSPRNSP